MIYTDQIISMHPHPRLHCVVVALRSGEIRVAHKSEIIKRPPCTDWDRLALIQAQHVCS